MKKRWPEATLVLIGLIAVLVLVIRPLRSRGPVEPSYQGSPLSHWVNRLDQPNSAPARTAIREIGVAAVPVLFRKVRFGELLPAGAIAALTFIGPPAVPALIARLDDSSEEVRLVAACALGCMAPQLGPERKAAVPGLIKLVTDPNLNVQLAAVTALGRMGSDSVEAIPALVRALRDEHVDDDGEIVYVREKAAEALGKMGPVAAASVPDLTMLLAHPSDYTRQQAAIALWRITHDTNQVLPVLTAMLSGTNVDTCQAAWRALQQIGHDVSLSPGLLAQMDAARPRRILPWRMMAPAQAESGSIGNEQPGGSDPPDPQAAEPFRPPSGPVLKP